METDLEAAEKKIEEEVAEAAKKRIGAANATKEAIRTEHREWRKALAKKEREHALAMSAREKALGRREKLAEQAVEARVVKVDERTLQFIEWSGAELRPKEREPLTEAESQIILMLCFDLVKNGRSEDQAAQQVRVDCIAQTILDRVHHVIKSPIYQCTAVARRSNTLYPSLYS